MLCTVRKSGDEKGKVEFILSSYSTTAVLYVMEKSNERGRIQEVCCSRKRQSEHLSENIMSDLNRMMIFEPGILILKFLAQTNIGLKIQSGI